MIRFIDRVLPRIGFPLLLVAAAASSGCAGMGGAPDSYEPTLPELASAPPSGNGAIYQAGYDVPLFENSTARRVGDILTVRLVESTNASKSSSTSTKKATDVTLPGPTIGGRPARGPERRDLFSRLLRHREHQSIVVGLLQRFDQGAHAADALFFLQRGFELLARIFE